ncbi:Proteasome endopeptidase complex protein [Dioscorea alata]|uniref:Proteasome endopeptidase complex protein n=1 Tax=Dioscorea alata TaxID=55571 RepID=A0ACB7V1R3_DIOAL|nr:Proteasome endopeptidase complex protein [Dioscorea alata]
MSLSFEEICCYWKMRFREMLQKGIDLSSVDVNYVSSRSWYLLNLFGLRGFFSLILGEENAMDDTQRMMQMGGFGFDASKVDPVVYNMLHEDLGNVSYSTVGGLSDKIRELRESIELPLMNPEPFIRVGIKPPKGVLLYGPLGTGKRLLARAIASNIDAYFLKVVSSAIIGKYIGESARLIREMFGYAWDHQANYTRKI